MKNLSKQQTLFIAFSLLVHSNCYSSSGNQTVATLLGEEPTPIASTCTDKKEIWDEFEFYKRPYNQMCMLGSHNAFASREDWYITPYCYDQIHGIEKQWNDYKTRFFKLTICWTPPRSSCCLSKPFKFYSGSYDEGQEIVLAHGNTPTGAYHVTKYFLKPGEPESFVHYLKRIKVLLETGREKFKDELCQWKAKYPNAEFLCVDDKEKHPNAKYGEDKLYDGRAIDRATNTIIPLPVPPTAFLYLYSFLGDKGKEAIHEALEKSGLTDYVHYPVLKRYKETERSYPVWPSVNEMLNKKTPLLILSTNPYDCINDGEKLSYDPSITIDTSAVAMSNNVPKANNFPQDPKAPLYSFFMRSTDTGYTAEDYSERGEDRGFDGYGISGYIDFYHESGKRNTLDYNTINVYEKIKERLIDFRSQNGSFPSDIQMQLIGKGPTYPCVTDSLVDEVSSANQPLSVDLSGCPAFSGSQIVAWINAHSQSKFAISGTQAPVERLRNVGALPSKAELQEALKKDLQKAFDEK